MGPATSGLSNQSPPRNNIKSEAYGNHLEACSVNTGWTANFCKQTIDPVGVGPELANVGPELVVVGSELVGVGPERVNVEPGLVGVGSELAGVGPELVAAGP